LHSRTAEHDERIKIPSFFFFLFFFDNTEQSKAAVWKGINKQIGSPVNAQSLSISTQAGKTQIHKLTNR